MLSATALFGHSITTEEKDRLAEYLGADPAAFKHFEDSYKKHILDTDYDTGNLMDVFGKRAFDALHSEIAFPNANDAVAEQRLIQRITDELCDVYYGNKIEGETVTNADLAQLKPEMRPQLTGTMAKCDIDTPSAYILLEMLRKSQTAVSKEERQLGYHLFRQGLDILDLDSLTYEILGMNVNAMGYWFPKLQSAVDACSFFRLPKTKIIKVPLPILQLSRLGYETLTPATLKIVDDFCMRVFDLDVTKTYFVKTGTFSSKFDFRNAKVHGEKEVRELGEYLLYLSSQAVTMAAPLTSPSIYGVSTTNEWVVREYIEDVENNPCIYKGMPLHTEYRLFIDCDTDEVLGVSPYWRPDVMKQRFGHSPDSTSPHQMHDYIVYSMHEKTLMERYDANWQKVVDAMKNILPSIDLPGQWSVDVMQNGDDFWIIDMAIASTSALSDCVPANKLKRIEENWLPSNIGDVIRGDMST